MECVLAGLTDKECLIYIDDIIIFSRAFEDHLQQLTNGLRKCHLKLKLPKCHFAQAEVDYLGHVVSAGGVKTDPRKAKAVTEYPVPSNM